MATKRRKLLVIAIISALSVLIALVLFSGNSSPGNLPVYQGKTAKQWLNEVFTTNQSAALDAFRKMDTNALPFLVQSLKKADSGWDRFYRGLYPKLAAFLQKHLSEPWAPDRDRWSAASFVMMNVRIGRAEKEELVRLMAGANYERGLYASFAAGRLGQEDSGCVPLLVDCLQGTNVNRRRMAAVGLGQIGPAAKAAIPALTAASTERTSPAKPTIVSVEAACALWRIDGQTKEPTQVLELALNDVDPDIRGEALVGLWQMRPHDSAVLPAIITQLRNGGAFQVAAVSMIGNYGPAAKEAVPDLVKLLNSQDSDLRQRARQSLKLIDPENAAKYEDK